MWSALSRSCQGQSRRQGVAAGAKAEEQPTLWSCSHALCRRRARHARVESDQRKAPSCEPSRRKSGGLPAWLSHSINRLSV